MVKGNYKHGLTNKPIYIRWKAIKDRCYNSNYAEFNYYGGRGIRMADIWVNNPKSFYDYVVSLENSLKSGFSLDRINNDGNYEPGNLRWSTQKTQSINSRMACKITRIDKNGDTKYYPSISSVEEDGFNKNCVRSCLNGRQKTSYGFLWKKI